MQNKSPEPLFQSGPLSVSATMLRFRGRRYKLVHIENLILKRPIFVMGVGFAAILAGFGWINADMLYAHEQLAVGLLALTALATTWPFGTLTLHSKTLSTNEGAITWFYNDLLKAQAAIEDAINPDNVQDL